MKYFTIFVCFCVFTLCNVMGKPKIKKKGVSDEEIGIIVRKHNDCRDLILDGKVPGQPKGKNINHLKWDPKLAIEAQKIADQCHFKHVFVNDTRWPVGQNLRIKRSTDYRSVADWDTTVQKWFDENKKYTYGNESIPGTGHYTEVIWDSCEYVGCGCTIYEKKKTKFKYNQLYVCNYGPSGNIKGYPPYQCAEENLFDSWF